MENSKSKKNGGKKTPREKGIWSASVNMENNIPNLDILPDDEVDTSPYEQSPAEVNERNTFKGSNKTQQNINVNTNSLNSSQRQMLNPNRRIIEQAKKEQLKAKSGNFISPRDMPKQYSKTIGDMAYEIEDLPKEIVQNHNNNSKLKIKNKSSISMMISPDGVKLEDNDHDISFEPSPKGEDDDKEPESEYQKTLCQKAQYAFKMIGCAMSLMNLIGQIVFYMKMEFASQYLLNSYLAFIILRVLLVLLVSAIYSFKNLIRHQVNQMNLKVDSDGSPSLSHHYMIRRQGIIMYMSYPFMLWFGFYRIYNPKDFKIFKTIGFFMELTFSLIPLIFIQATNNATLKITTLKSIQSYSLAMGALVIFELLAQVVVMMCELRQIRKLKDTGLASESEFTPLSEENKRKKNYKQTMIFSWAGLSIFVLVIMLCNKFMQGRSCAPGQTIHHGVCVYCEDAACNKCSVYNYCEECETGYFGTGGKCYFCDPRGLCQNCNDQQTCIKCIPGTRLEDGECLRCGDNDGCALCKEGGCQQCKPGYYLDLRTTSCVKCTDKMSSCEECTGPKTCTKCIDNIATLHKNTCQCVGLWEESNQVSSCTCNDYQTLTNECSICSDIILGCQTCTQSESNRVFGNIQIGKANNQLGYLRCEDCGGSTMYLDMENSQCKKCSGLTPGCYKCNHLGFGCTECQKGYFINIVSTTMAFECEACSLHLPYCTSCSSKEKCLECATGYDLIHPGYCQKS